MKRNWKTKGSQNRKWISKLRSKVSSKADRILFEEASECFLGGQLRAAYIMSWVCIAESLKRKIYEFSDLKDGRAVEAVKEIEKLEKDERPTDSKIIEQALKTQIVDLAEGVEVNFFWKKRCLFAHPYAKQPTTKEVEHILEKMIDITLGRELMYSKSYLEERIIDISTKPHITSISEVEMKNFAKKEISLIPLRLHPTAFKMLLFQVGELLKIGNKKSQIIKLRLFICELLELPTTILSDKCWGLKVSSTKFPLECTLGFMSPSVWHKVPNEIKEMLIRYIESEKDPSNFTALKWLSSQMLTGNKLEANFKDRIFKRLDAQKFNDVIEYYGETGNKYRRISKELITNDFDKINRVIDYIKDSNILENLDEEFLYELGRTVQYKSKKGNYLSTYMISDIINDRITVPESFIKGVISGTFIDEKSLIIFPNQLSSVSNLLNTFSNNVQKEMYEQINESILVRNGVYSKYLHEKFVKNNFDEKIDELKNKKSAKPETLRLLRQFIGRLEEKLLSQIEEETSVTTPPKNPATIPYPVPNLAKPMKPNSKNQHHD